MTIGRQQLSRVLSRQFARVRRSPAGVTRHVAGQQLLRAFQTGALVNDQIVVELQARTGVIREAGCGAKIALS